ncbi:MAG: RdgB/HAM1 family non-canonical purine NTP pyrophosphatase [Sphingobacteriales bacterium]|nr:RdgB/HAM1 family non-canonical purine NTP pyrophosphatase [Sphingobacteriales bacterium]
MKLIFASNNQHKIEEMRSILGNRFDVVSLKEAGIDIDIPEPHDTLEANASEKAKVIYEMTGVNCFSEDTGLEVYALNGEPGVKSARYAGEGRSFDANIEKLLINLAGKADRRARFRAVISLLIDGKEILFEGICEGKIIDEKRGNGGFGYDPVFVPEASARTFAEMSREEKANYSHRARAAEKLVAFLNKA